MKEENSITITNFLDNCDEEECGWVVKQPFVTDQIVKEGLKTKDAVLKKPSSIFNNDIHQGIYPYAMIKPCMKNRKEYKVVVYIPSKSIICMCVFSKDNIWTLQESFSNRTKSLRSLYFCDPFKKLVLIPFAIDYFVLTFL
jgi:hypothetical protein